MLRSKLFTVVTIALFIFGVAMVGLAQGQKAKTVKLPNGEEVVDIRGEWDDQVENYGPWEKYGKYTNILKITLEDNTFVGTRMKHDKWNVAGTTAIKGILDKNGITKVQMMTAAGPLNATGKISNDGNKIVIDEGKKGRHTLTRK